MSRCDLLITHYVSGNTTEIFDGFTQDLFEALSPSFPPAKLLRYDGNAVGDLVEIRLGIPPVTVLWRSEITAHIRSDEKCLFVDEGRKLPVPLNYWVHRHRIEQAEAGKVAIIEDITFGTPFSWLTALMKPIISAQFEARGEMYTEFFKK